MVFIFYPATDSRLSRSYCILANNMTDWKALAASVEPPIPEEILDQVIPPLQALDAAFHTLLRNLPPDTLMWRAPEAMEQKEAG